MTTTTVATLVCLLPKVIQQIESMLPGYLHYKCESPSPREEQSLYLILIKVIASLKGEVVIMFSHT